MFDLARDYAGIAHDATVSDDVLTHIPLAKSVKRTKTGEKFVELNLDVRIST